MGLINSIRNIFSADEGRRPKKIGPAGTLAGGDAQNLAKGFKPVRISPTGGLFVGRATYERPNYDFYRIQNAIATDSYISTAFAKYIELMWKESYDLISENPEAVAYVYQRFDFFSLAMQRDFDDFLREVSEQLIKFHNVFIVRARGPLDQFFPTRLNSVNGKMPVIGFFLLPVERVVIQRDPQTGKPLAYQTNVGIPNNSSLPSFKAEDVIHLKLNAAPGSAFGYPFVLNVLDDVLSLRQLEEDILNLVHNELFTLALMKVGTPDDIRDEAELEAARRDLEALRDEGGLVMPGHYDFKLEGSAGKALDASPYLDHFRQRVAVGLGVNEIHLGMASANRSVSDRLDVALYDRVKVYQRYLSSQIRLLIMNELLLEGGFDPYVEPSAKGPSDRVEFRFREIDVDTQVKKDANTIFKWTSNAIVWDEMRQELGLDPEAEINDLYQFIIAAQSDVQVASAQAQLNPQPTPTAPGAPPKVPPKPPVSPTMMPATRGTGARPGSQLKSPNGPSKGPANIINPKNQRGTRTSPNIRHSDDLVVSPLFEEAEKQWGLLSGDVFDYLEDTTDFNIDRIRLPIMLAREGIEAAIATAMLQDPNDAKEELSLKLSLFFERLLQHIDQVVRTAMPKHYDETSPGLERLPAVGATLEEFWAQLQSILRPYEVSHVPTMSSMRRSDDHD